MDFIVFSLFLGIYSPFSFSQVAILVYKSSTLTSLTVSPGLNGGVPM
jgi:hypothetical protein